MKSNEDNPIQRGMPYINNIVNPNHKIVNYLIKWCKLLTVAGLYIGILSHSPNLIGQVSFQDAYPSISFNFPVEIVNSGDGTDRMFVVEQPGIIRVFNNNPSVTAGQVSTFLNISSRVFYSPGQEIGLLGLAFHPNYSQNGYFYVYYTRSSQVPGIGVEMVLSRFSVSSSNPNAADAGSELEIFSFDKNQNNSNHNGGKIAFGPDGYLYISIGDGGGGGDPLKNGQNLNTVFGSILRIDIDIDGNNPIETNPDLPNGNYEIPSNNPRLGQSGLDELYAWGIRNTWKFSFDTPTGRLWGADVGQENFEEINLITLGGNYGWNRFEANSIEDASTSLVTSPDIRPVFAYDHSSGDVSITGGYVYRGSSDNPSLQGRYIYGDYVSGRVWSLNYNAGTNTGTPELLFRTNGQFISSFGLDEAGEIYFSDYSPSAKIYRIVGGNTGPVTVAVNGVGAWAQLGSGTNGVVHALANTNSDEVYIGGEFSIAGGRAVSNLASFNTNTGWNDLGGGANGTVNAVAVAGNGDVYVGGDFSVVGGISASNIAVWNGSTWAGLAGGTNGPVAKIGIDNNGLVYVGGAFETAGGVTANNIASWNGSSWAALTDSGNGVSGTNNEIRAIAFDENNLMYVGGNFDSAGGNAAARIATWNGSNWGTLGSGTSGFVQAIAITPFSVYAGGNFVLAGGATVNRIARWSRAGQNWEALGQGLSGNVNDIIHDGTYAYVAGNFETASDVPNVNEIMTNIARWSVGSGWEALGPGSAVGVGTQANSLVFSNTTNYIFTGGNFSTAGNIGASNIALWGDPIGDSDQDGVTDGFDQCPGTPPNSVVGFDGCIFDNLPINNFNIAVKSTSCIGFTNGSIDINTIQNLNYEVNIIGNGVNETLTFNNELQIDNLAPGNYELCFTADEIPDFESCSLAVVSEPDILAVQSIVNEADSSVTLRLSGSESYNIKVNDLPIQTEEDEITLYLSAKTNIIEVSTDKDCQGKISEVIVMDEEAIVFPNPFENELNIGINPSETGLITGGIYDLSGKLITSFVRDAGTTTISLDTTDIPKGLYVLNFNVNGVIRTYKLIKQ